MKFARCCSCGASWRGDVSSIRERDELNSLWLLTHVGSGHSPCNSRQASAARVHAERQFEREADAQARGKAKP